MRGGRSGRQRIARYARALNLDPRLTLANVHIARAFTCYQLVETVSRLNGRADTIDADLGTAVFAGD